MCAHFSSALDHQGGVASASVTANLEASVTANLEHTHTPVASFMPSISVNNVNTTVTASLNHTHL